MATTCKGCGKVVETKLAEALLANGFDDDNIYCPECTNTTINRIESRYGLNQSVCTDACGGPDNCKDRVYDSTKADCKACATDAQEAMENARLLRI